MANLLRAGAANLRGQKERAVVLLREAIYGFDAADMSLYGTSARRRLAGLVGGDEGRSLLAQTDGWLRSQQVANADALTAIVAPGYDGVNSPA